MRASLKTRLIWILLGLTMFAWISSALLTFTYASRALLEQVDRQLEQYGDLVTYITQVYARQLDEGLQVYEPWLQQDPEAIVAPMVIETPGGDDLVPALNVFLSGRLIAHLEDSPHFGAPEDEGFRFVQLEDSHWRVRSVHDRKAGVWILVGIEIDAARWAMLSILGQALFPLLVVLPLTVAVLYYGVSRGLRPLQELASQIARRSPGALDPVASEAVPEEMLPVVEELNELLDRLAFALDSEQRFTANAAHELRTPLAAIKTEVQLCQRQMEEAKDRDMLTRIAQRVDRASHSVEQLLVLARVDPQSPLAGEPVELANLVAEVVVECAHLAADRGLTLEPDIEAGAGISGNRELLAILVRNLVLNACRYACGDKAITVSVQSVGTLVSLVIRNDCEPLSVDEFRQVSRRFYRVPGSAGLGAGLGLSIVSRIAEQHGASFSTGPGEQGRGFVARVDFPA